MKIFKNQFGDTIVEVLIAITIVSSVLGGAYAASNRSLRSTQQAQEHTVALKLAESQIEALRAGPKTGPNNIFNTTELFCMSGLTGVLSNASAAHDPMGFLDSSPTNYVTLFTPACSASNGRYGIAIDRAHASVGGHSDYYTFTVYVRWYSLSKAGDLDQVVLSYKIGD